MALVYRSLLWEELKQLAYVGDVQAAQQILDNISNNNYKILSKEMYEELIQEAEQQGYEAGFKEGVNTKNET